MFVEKVVIYITQGNKLLVFRHTNYPQAGIQVPAGTVGTNEDLIEATIREASEETGLAVGKLEFRSKLGTDVFQFDDVDGSPPPFAATFTISSLSVSPASDGSIMKRILPMERRRRSNSNSIG